MKDHEIAALVNALRDIAIKYHGSQQLREQIAAVVVPALRGARNATNTESQVTALKAYRDEMRDACSHFQDTSDVEERLTAILESVSPHPPRTLPDDECEAIGSVTLEAEKAERERQEPVAWAWDDAEDEIYQAWKEHRKDPSAAQYRKVYAAPPIQRQDPSPVPHVDPDWLANVIRRSDQQMRDELDTIAISLPELAPESWNEERACGWNMCLYTVRRLNGIKS